VQFLVGDWRLLLRSAKPSAAEKPSAGIRGVSGGLFRHKSN